MPAVRAANVCELVAVLTDGQKPFINRFHVAYGGVAPLSASEAQALAVDFGNVYHTRFLPFMSNVISSVQFEANDLDPAGFANGVSIAAFTGPGSFGPMTMNDAAMILWHTEATRYRGSRPRTYLSGIDGGSQLDQRHFTAAFATSLRVAAQGFLSDINALTFGTGPRSVSLIYLATVRHKVPLAVPQQWAINDATTTNLIRSQRRRLEM